ncbi:MAG: LytTR family DNA-binding domain-containing protein [Muribaculaceae bacterium]|nr:LytTR family DNA-binding domain-containing protein [Muribaculaceae bacterium]
MTATYHSPIRCIVADDEPLAVRLLETYISRSPGLVSTGSYTNADDALAAIQSGNADLAFLDIQMPRMSGLQLAAAARDSGVRVVFVTAYRDFAVEGFRVNAIDYLLKPVSFDEFTDAVTRAAEILTRKATQTTTPAETFITVRSDYRQVRIDHDDIAYIEGLKDYVKIYTLSRPRPIITQMSLKAIQHTLPSTAFMRVHRSYIIALRQVQSFDRSHALLRDTSIPIGDTYRAEFLTQMRQ